MPKVGSKMYYGSPDDPQKVKDASASKAMPIEQSYTILPGGILNRSSGPGYKTTVEYARGGGAARKDATRFYKVEPE